MLRFSALLLPAALLLLSPAAQAQTPTQASGKPVTFTIINGDFLTTLVRLERQYHIQCVLQDSIDAHRKINVALSGVLLPLAMRCLALSADAQVTQNPDGVYVFTSQSPRLLLVQGYSMPPPHFSGNGSSRGFGSFGFGSFEGFSDFGSSHFQWQPVEFSRVPPAENLDLSPRPLKVKAAETTLPSGVERIYALGKSF